MYLKNTPSKVSGIKNQNIFKHNKNPNPEIIFIILCNKVVV